MKCPSCNKEQEDDAVFCMFCGSKLSQKCPSCGIVMPSNALFCKGCGSRLAPQEQPAPIESPSEKVNEEALPIEEVVLEEEKEQPAPVESPSEKVTEGALPIEEVVLEEEKEQDVVVESFLEEPPSEEVHPEVEPQSSLATFLSADILGSTELISDKDIELAKEMMEKTIATLSKNLRAWHGEILRQTGDGVIAYFKGESHPLQACYAAANLQQTLITEKSPMRIRIGIHSSLSLDHKSVVKGDKNSLLQSPSIKIAQCVESNAPSGGILISQTTYQEGKDYLETGPVTPISLPDEIVPLNTYELYRISPSVMKVIQAPKTLEIQEEDEIEFQKDVFEHGERKFITNCFIKLVKRGEGPQSAEQVSKLIKSVISSFDGTYVKHVGDMIYVLFGAPVAFEDHPLRACLAAYTIREQIIDKRWPLDIRIGIHTGEAVFVRDLDQSGEEAKCDAYGASVNLAARMMQTAPSDHIQLSEDTFALVESYTQTIPLGEKFVKGFTKSVTTYALVGVDQEGIRSQLDARVYADTHFYGRKNEIKMFSLAIAQAKQDHGSLLAFKADPGMGKTRLMYELCRNIVEKGVVFHSVTSFSYESKDSFSTLRQFIKNLFAFSATQSQTVHVNRLYNALRGIPFTEEFAQESIVAMLGGKVEEEGWLGLDPTLQLDILFNSLWEYLQFQSQKNLLVLVFEDLQWCDSDSLKFLQFLCARLKNSSMVILLDYRPEMHLPEELLDVGAEIELKPLSQEESDNVIVDLLPGGQELQALRVKILEMSGGNPFYIEEYVKALVSNGTVTLYEDGYVLNETSQVEALPQTLKGLISSRIDQLPLETKILLQQASIFGRVFKSTMLRYISDLSAEDFRSALTFLEQKSFITQTALFPEPEFSFKHNYISDVAYGTMLRKVSMSYHARLVEEIEQNYPDSLEMYYFTLAQHAYSAELWRKSLHYYNLLMPNSISINFPVSQYVSVGHKVRDAYRKIGEEKDKAECFEEYGRSFCLWLHALTTQGDVELASEEASLFAKEAVEEGHEDFELVALGWELLFLAFSGKASEAYETSQEIIKRMDGAFTRYPPNEARLIKDGILLWIIHIFFPLGKYDEFDKIDEEIISSPGEFASAHYTLGVSAKAAGYFNLYICNFLRARQETLQDKLPFIKEQVASLPDAEPRLLAMASLVTYNLFVGNFSVLAALLEEGMPLVNKLQIGFIEALLQAYTSVNRYYLGDKEQALEWGRKAIETFRKVKYIHTSFGAAIVAEVFSYCGAFKEALDVIEELLAIAEPDNQVPLLAQCYRVKALTYNMMDENHRHDEEIAKLLAKAEEMTDKIGCNLQHPFIHLNYAEYYQRLEDEQKAVDSFKRALNLFKEYGMKGWYEYYSEKEKTFLKDGIQSKN